MAPPSEARPLFDADRSPWTFAPGAILLPRFALDAERALLDDLRRIEAEAPFRHMVTRGGWRMSAGMTNCGALGWISDRRGYRYEPVDPDSGNPWPSIPESFARVADAAAEHAGYARLAPDACLINRYVPGAQMSLHQDRDEQDFDAPIVSVSLGLPIKFLFGGLERGDKPQRIPLEHGDVVVFGGPSRLCFHGVAPLPKGDHPTLGSCRINLTFRRAG